MSLYTVCKFFLRWYWYYLRRKLETIYVSVICPNDSQHTNCTQHKLHKAKRGSPDRLIDWLDIQLQILAWYWFVCTMCSWIWVTWSISLRRCRLSCLGHSVTKLSICSRTAGTLQPIDCKFTSWLRDRMNASIWSKSRLNIFLTKAWWTDGLTDAQTEMRGCIVR